jgi:ferredoxin
MKAIVDQETCIGCGLCASECPDVFEMDGALAKVIADPVPADAEECATSMVEGCPVAAISTE